MHSCTQKLLLKYCSLADQLWSQPKNNDCKNVITSLPLTCRKTNWWRTFWIVVQRIWRKDTTLLAWEAWRGRKHFEKDIVICAHKSEKETVRLKILRGRKLAALSVQNCLSLHNEVKPPDEVSHSYTHICSCVTWCQWLFFWQQQSAASLSDIITLLKHGKMLFFFGFYMLEKVSNQKIKSVTVYIL